MPIHNTNGGVWATIAHQGWLLLFKFRIHHYPISKSEFGLHCAFPFLLQKLNCLECLFYLWNLNLHRLQKSHKLLLSERKLLLSFS